MADVAIRPYADLDEPEVLQLLDTSLGGGPAGRRPPEFFRWKHIKNPFGRSLMLVAESEGRIVGLRAFMRWRFVASGRPVRAVRAVDTATHPDHQGRGIFSKLTLEALEMLSGDADLVFNTPNERSLPGYLKMGWRVVGRLPVRIRVRRPIRFVRGLRSTRGGDQGPLERFAPVGHDVGELLARHPSIAKLIPELVADSRLTTDRSLDYLRWRYADAPLLGYRAVAETDGRDVHGMGLFRVRARGALTEAAVAEVMVREDDRRTATRLLRKIAAIAAVDHLTCSFPRRTAADRASVASGFLPIRTGPTLVVRCISEALDPDPASPRSWALSLGDAEVF
ncbi:MAG TPA: GNAT family N-acetyltransferase [Actinomycetota bacterium]